MAYKSKALLWLLLLLNLFIDKTFGHIQEETYDIIWFLF